MKSCYQELIVYFLIIGNFFRVRGNNNGNFFNSSLNVINPIDLIKPGKYKMSLWAIFHCANELCGTANDMIQIRIKEDGAPGFDKIIFQLSTEDGRKDRKWVFYEISFEAATSKIFVFFHSILNFLLISQQLIILDTV